MRPRVHMRDRLTWAKATLSMPECRLGSVPLGGCPRVAQLAGTRAATDIVVRNAVSDASR
jgi:enoyl-CoA hydratase/carnithine racemase